MATTRLPFTREPRHMCILPPSLPLPRAHPAAVLGTFSCHHDSAHSALADHPGGRRAGGCCPASAAAASSSPSAEERAKEAAEAEGAEEARRPSQPSARCGASAWPEARMIPSTCNKREISKSRGAARKGSRRMQKGSAPVESQAGAGQKKRGRAAARAFARDDDKAAPRRRPLWPPRPRRASPGSPRGRRSGRRRPRGRGRRARGATARGGGRRTGMPPWGAEKKQKQREVGGGV